MLICRAHIAQFRPFYFIFIRTMVHALSFSQLLLPCNVIELDWIPRLISCWCCLLSYWIFILYFSYLFYLLLLPGITGRSCLARSHGRDEQGFRPGNRRWIYCRPLRRPRLENGRFIFSSFPFVFIYIYSVSSFFFSLRYFHFTLFCFLATFFFVVSPWLGVRFETRRLKEHEVIPSVVVDETYSEWWRRGGRKKKHNNFSVNLCVARGRDLLTRFTVFSSFLTSRVKVQISLSVFSSFYCCQTQSGSFSPRRTHCPFRIRFGSTFEVASRHVV